MSTSNMIAANACDALTFELCLSAARCLIFANLDVCHRAQKTRNIQVIQPTNKAIWIRGIKYVAFERQTD